MPPIKCSNGKWKIGENGDCVFDTKELAKKAYVAYLIKKKKKQTG